MATSTTRLPFLCLLALLCKCHRIFSVRLNDADKAFHHDSEGGGRMEEATQGANVEVWVESATGLHDWDGANWTNGLADPFVVVIYDGHPPWTTSTKENTTLPIWHEQNTFDNYDCAAKKPINFKVYDHDDEANDLLGETTLPAEDFMYQTKLASFELPLKFKNGSIIAGSTLSVKVKMSGGEEHPCGSPPSSPPSAPVEGGGGIKEGDMVEIKDEESGSVGRKGTVTKKDVHGEEDGDAEVQVKFDDGKEPQEDWFEEGDVEKVNTPSQNTPDEDVDDELDEREVPAGRTGSGDSNEGSEDSSDLKPAHCRDWTEDNLPKEWKQVESRRRKGTMVWKHSTRKLRVASVKRACEYETGILKWH